MTRRWLGVALAAVLACALASCQVTTRVAVNAAANGSGTVAVTVTFDRQAAAAVGGITAQLQTADLSQAGWAVSPPTPGPGGATIVTVTKAFATPHQLQGILDQVVGNPTALSVYFDRRHTFWHRTIHLHGTVDLTCGTGCFADPGLSHAGPGGGLDINRLASGADPARVLAFQVSLGLPGRLRAPTASSLHGGTATWTVPWGQTIRIDAASESWNGAPLVMLGVLAGALLICISLLGWRRWHRRSRQPPSEPVTSTDPSVPTTVEGAVLPTPVAAGQATEPGARRRWGRRRAPAGVTVPPAP